MSVFNPDLSQEEKAELLDGMFLKYLQGLRDRGILFNTVIDGEPLVLKVEEVHQIGNNAELAIANIRKSLKGISDAPE